MSKPMNHMNLRPQHMQFQNMNPHHRMLDPRDSMSFHSHTDRPPHHPMYLNDGPPPLEAINNTYVSATMSIQQLNIPNLDPDGPPGESQIGTIHHHASSENVPDPQQQQFPSNNPQFFSQFKDLQAPPSNLSVYGGQPPPYR